MTLLTQRYSDKISGQLFCYVRVPTWCPFRLQIYFNGHGWLAAELRDRNIGHQLIDNLFVRVADFTKAQKIADELKVDLIHRILDQLAQRFCPVIEKFNLRYHWSVMQAEYATDIVFKRQQDLNGIYDHLTRTAIHTVKPENVATFLSRKLHGNYTDELGNNFNTRIEGTRIKHVMGPASIKMYDKHGLALRIETTINDLSFFKHYRPVEHRDGSQSPKMAPMKKGLYSLGALAKLMRAANHRYLQFISDIDDPSQGLKSLSKISKSVTESNRPYKGFNLFNTDDLKLFEAVCSGEFNISGFQNKHLRQKLTDKSSAQIDNHPKPDRFSLLSPHC